MIKLKQEHGGFAVGAVIELQGEVESTLIAQGKAEKHAGPATNTLISQENKPDPKPEPPKRLTVPEALTALREHTQALKYQLARGSKSDADAIGARLDEIMAKVQAILDQDYPQEAKKVVPQPVQTLPPSQQTVHGGSSVTDDPAQAYRHPNMPGYA